MNTPRTRSAAGLSAAIIAALLASTSPFAALAQSAETEAAAAAVPGGIVLAPPPEDHGHAVPMAEGARPAAYDRSAFAPDPAYPDKPYAAADQIAIYGGKTAVDGPRPLVELGYPMYQEGDIGSGYTFLGEKNIVRPQLIVFGDWRTAVAYNDNGTKETAALATRLNLEVDLRLTSTERIHALFRPLDRRGTFSNYQFAGGDRVGDGLRLDGNVETLFFEGDLGAMLAGATGSYNSLDMPIAAGKMPLLFQNGVWMEDVVIGGAASILAMNSGTFDISNLDVTVFVAADDATTPALKDQAGNFAQHAGHVFGATAFADMLEGYLEVGYGRVEDTRRSNATDFSYDNATIGFTRRYGGFLSNSVRLIVNTGQDPGLNASQTADGFVFLLENSLITSLPSTLVPYANFFWGNDRPQSLLRDPGAGGVLKNTGINFETDGLTGFPKLDDSANDTFGGALGVMYLFNLDQQIVAEVAALRPVGEDNEPGRIAKGDQYAFGMRYQVPISDRWIVRLDGIVAERENEESLAGAKLEFRWKF